MSEKEKSSFGKYLAIGCVGIIVLCVVGGFLAFRGISSWASGKINEYTQTNRVEFPTVALTPDEQVSLEKRVAEFQESLKTGTTNEPAALLLGGDEINSLLNGVKEMKEISDSVHVSVESNRLTGEISLPIDKFFGIGKGRFLNGKAEFSVGLQNDRLQVFAKSVEVNGKALSPEIMMGLANENFAQGATNAEFMAFLKTLKDIRVEDGKLQFIPKAAKEDSESEPAAGKDDGKKTKEAAPAKSKADSAEAKKDPVPATPDN